VQLVRERVVVPNSAIKFVARETREVETVTESGATEKSTVKTSRFRVATVGQADVPGINRRIYPTETWAPVIEKANKVQCPAGMLGGAVDHVEVQHAGNLRDKCILWHSLAFGRGPDRPGRVLDRGGDRPGQQPPGVDQGRRRRGFFDLRPRRGARAGRDRAEREKYGLDDVEPAVVMEQLELIAIDAVDNPSFRRSWMHKDFRSENAAESAGNTKETQTMTLEQLKKDHPELVAAIEKAANDAKAAAEKTLGEKNAALESEQKKSAALAKFVGEVVSKLAKDHGIKLETEVLPADADKAVKALEEQNKSERAKLASDKDAEIEGLKKQVSDKDALIKQHTEAAEKAKAESDKLAAEKAEEGRKKLVSEKAAELLKGNKYAKAIAKAVTEASADKAFTADKVEALVKAKNEEYAEVASAQEGFSFDITGVASEAAVDSEEVKGALPIATLLAGEL
jgi:hypothetical protein